MKCVDCVYHYITPEDKYPHCQFKPIANCGKQARAIPMLSIT